MLRPSNDPLLKRDRQRIALAGMIGVAVAFAATEAVIAYSHSQIGLSVISALFAGALVSLSAASSVSARYARLGVSEQNARLDAALNNMIQGLCMFDAQNRLVVWNERYRAMYNIDPLRIWRGCTISDLLKARMAAGMFPLDPEKYDRELRAALKQGKCFTLNIDLADGRTISVVNQPIESGGWVATHEDVSERRRAERELEQARSFLNMIIENVPSPIIVKDIPNLKYLLVNHAAEKYFGVDRAAIIGKATSDLLSKASAQLIENEDRKAVESGQISFLDEHTVVTPGNGARIATATRMPVMGPDGKAQYLISAINDVTDHKRDERELEQARSFLNTIIENVPSPIIVKDPDLRYLLFNRAAEKCLGVDRSALLGKTAAEVMPGMSDTVDEHDRRLLESGKSIFVDEHAVATPGNGTRIVTATRLPVMGPDGKVQYLISMIHDVTDRKRDELRLAHMAHHDVLTGLSNRIAFNECIAATLRLAADSGESFAMLSLDLDRFKTVNDVFGHTIGDRLLRELAGRLEQACQGAFLARTGGDEFHVITACGPQPASAEALAEKLCAALDADIDIDGVPLRVGLTVGVAIFPQDAADASTLVANADAALVRAKSERRGSIRFFEQSMDRQLREKHALQQDLRTALGRDEFALHFQPQANIDGEVNGFEALVRWHHPRYGMIALNTFIPLAEESGIIIELGEWILRAACREAASWPRPLDIAINLSPVQFQHGDLPKLVHEVLLDTGLAPARLVLEITEGVLIGEFNRGVAILRRLKHLGVRIAMDDFGTGYSSLSYLQSFPFDKIKIDKSFIANLGHSQQAATIVRAVIALGHGLDLPVVAEGVETKEQLKFLADESCDEIQGYLFGRPKPIADYADLIGRGPGPEKKLAATG